MNNIYEAQRANKIKSFFIVLVFAVFVALATYILARALGVYSGYEPGNLGLIGIALIVSGFSSLIGYYYSDKIVLGISGARPASRKTDFTFYTVAQNISIGAGLPVPKLYVIPDSAPNAFATGRDPEHAVICVTTGLLDKLERTELEGVIGHEMSHIKNYDTRLMSVVSVMVGLIALLGDWLLRASWFGGKSDNDNRDSGSTLIIVLGIVFAILSPIVGQLIQLAISRRREFVADAGSVEITRQPSGLISALVKISSDKEALEVANKATAHLYVCSPFKNKKQGSVGWFAELFNTHPPMSERIKALESMA
jgi:heat shock protein HtpX